MCLLATEAKNVTFRRELPPAALTPNGTANTLRNAASIAPWAEMPVAQRFVNSPRHT